MIKRFAALLIMMLSMAAASAAQLEWDKPKTGRAIPNPSAVNANREQLGAIVREILQKNSIPTKTDTVDETRGTVTIVTEPVVFTRGIVAKSQLRHFADLGAAEVTDVTRGRVSLRIEIAPTSPTLSLVGIYGTFEGFSQGTLPKWVDATSRGILEDKFLKLIVTESMGTVFDDVELGDTLLEVNETQ